MMYFMMIGDIVTIQQIKDQTEYRWVVLADLARNKDGSIKHGTVKYISDTKTKAGKKAIKLMNEGNIPLVIQGVSDPVQVGSVFVK